MRLFVEIQASPALEFIQQFRSFRLRLCLCFFGSRRPQTAERRGSGGL
jgi:hypothetical protein